METAVQISALAVLAAVMCVLIREKEKTLALMLSILACCGILLLGAQLLHPLMTVIAKLKTLTGIQDTIISPLLKTAGIGLITQIAMGVCSDAGEVSLSKTVEISGGVLALYTALPLLLSVIELLEKLLGGSL